MNEAAKTDNRKKLWSTRDRSWFPLEAFHEDVAILNDGTLVAVLEVVPLDMALMAREESEAVLGRFWHGIKTLPSPVSIYLGRRRQDAAAYLLEVDQRLVALADRSGEQEDFYGRLLEEHYRLLQDLLRGHVRSRYSLLAITQDSHHGLGQAAGLVFRKRAMSGKKSDLDQAQLEQAQEQLEMNVRRVEDLLGRVGLKHIRYTGIQLAVELARLCRPDLAGEGIAFVEKEMASPPAAVEAMEEKD